ncbi:MAG TPA: NAD(P)/FAD-dependent oxidoreductase [Burkholderiales bacterium]|nr:NAD(P)/FAD-dependent oxidoreductase [Burkholderiales bacterium]
MRLDVIVVGAGFAGLYMLHRARGLGLSARVFEDGAGVGGTWYWNRYPGARCDIESLEYSYQFDERLQQEWRWSERFAAQPEILRYADHVADRFGLRRDIQLNTRVVAAHFDESARRWTVRTADGVEATARFLVMATGCLSVPNRPRLPGLDVFRGAVYHTGAWPHDKVDFRGLRVGVIGTGSSAVQSIPLIAEEALSLVVFQRTATYSVPARNAPLDPAYEAHVKADYASFRARNSQMPNAFGSNLPRNEASALAATPQERRRAFEERWRHGGLFLLGAFGDLILDARANETAAEFVRDKIRAAVRDPALAERLLPRQRIGCKRLCLDSGYYETYNRDNVELVDVNEAPIEGATPRGLRAGGRDYALDAIVFATGFDAMTGALARIDIRGRGARALSEAWAGGPRSYLGLAVAGFPNLFTITGPGSPSVLTNMLVSIEQHVSWIADCIAQMSARGHATIEALPQAQDAWVAHVNAVADRTVYPLCNSWYLGANVPGKPRVFMPLLGFPAYVKKCDEVVARGYEGFALA